MRTFGILKGKAYVVCSVVLLILFTGIYLFSKHALARWQKDIELRTRLEVAEESRQAIIALKLKIKEEREKSDRNIKERVKHVQKLVENNPVNCVIRPNDANFSLLKQASSDSTISIRALQTGGP